ncbi:cupin domain-containing protein [Chloroflexota bacterium]
MKIISVYSGPDGESHFKDIELTFKKERTGSASITKPAKATHAFFREAKGDDNGDWHTAPRKQLIIVLKGKLEIEVADGSKRRFVPGDVLLAEDTTGHGHLSRSFNRTAFYVPIEGEFT